MSTCLSYQSRNRGYELRCKAYIFRHNLFHIKQFHKLVHIFIVIRNDIVRRAIIEAFSDGTVDVIQHTIKAGVPYKNPFSTREDATETTFDHDTIINYVVGFSYGKTGAKFADVLAVKMMGF